MSLIQSDLLLGQEGGAGYQIERSLRFNSADSAYLSKNFASAGNRKTWTWAGWMKLATPADGFRNFFQAYDGSSRAANDFLQLTIIDGALGIANDTVWFRQSTALFRDYSAWMHVVCAFDTTQATGANRIKLYVNGVQLTTFSLSSDPTLNADYGVNRAIGHQIGQRYGGQYFNGYLADVHFIDGQALTPTSFGEFDTNNVWQPKKYSGPTPTGNSFWLPFSDNSAATATTLGKDGFLLGNDWTPVNLYTTTVTQPYSQNFTVNWPGYSNTYHGDGWTRGFNANLDDGVLVYNNGESTLTLPAGVTWSTKIRIRLYWYGGIIAVNGTTLTGSFTATPTWYDFTSQLGSSGTLNTIKITSVNSNYMAFCAVELDNIVLYDYVPASIDSLVDSPTNYGIDTGAGGEVRGNYCTLNPLSKIGDANNALNLSNGNLTFATPAAPIGTTGTIGVSSGKWYWELTCSSITASQLYFGVTNVTFGSTGSRVEGIAGIRDTGVLYNLNGATLNGSGTTAFAANDVVRFAYDADNARLFIGKNGTWLNSSDPAAGTNASFTNVQGPTLYPMVSDGSTSAAIINCNFGQRPFAYTAPSGFKALCTQNLPTTITNGATAMDVALWTGNGGALTVSGYSLSPDFVWLKSRSAAGNHGLFDIVRGGDKQLISNSTSEELTQNAVTFTSNGFTSNSWNINGTTWAGWMWDAGSSTVTNTAGSITSQVRANPSAGFSVVTYTGNGSSGSVGHGLGIAPQMVIVFNRSGMTYQGSVYHAAFGTNPQQNVLVLSSPSTIGTNNTYPWNNTQPNSTVFSVNNWNCTANNFVAYCFAPVNAYSAFGSYTGNGSTDGPFIFCNFRPRFILIKSNSLGLDWCIFDAARDGYNADNDSLYPNSTQAENNFVLSSELDILSNGFKPRANRDRINQSAATYVWAAFAEHPFALARAR